MTDKPKNNTSRMRQFVSNTERSDKSLFRLGIDCLNYALNHGLPFEVAFWLLLAYLHSSVR
jgi:hypothetical protein